MKFAIFSSLVLLAAAVPVGPGTTLKADANASAADIGGPMDLPINADVPDADADALPQAAPQSSQAQPMSDDMDQPTDLPEADTQQMPSDAPMDDLAENQPLDDIPKEGLGSRLGGKLSGIGSKIGQDAQEVYGDVDDAVESDVPKIKSAGKGLGRQIVDTGKKVGKGIKNTYQKVDDQIEGSIPKLNKFGKKLGQKLANGGKKVGNGIKHGFEKLGDAARKGYHFEANADSPLPMDPTDDMDVVGKPSSPKKLGRTIANKFKGLGKKLRKGPTQEERDLALESQ